MPTRLADGVRAMQYPVRTTAASKSVELDSASDLIGRLHSFESRMQDRERQFARDLEAAQNAAFERGKEVGLQDQASQREQLAAQLKQAIDEFRRRSEQYLSHVEQEVVHLALAIAERVIRREAQMDPLLLAGAVRVALGQLAESTEVQLRVPVEQKEMWVETLKLMPGLAIRPAVIGDPALQATEVTLETNVGSVELGTRAQLNEIEKGFFDLLDARRECRSAEGEQQKALTSLP